MISGRERRRKQKLLLRQEGEAAALAGRPFSAPQSYCLMDRLQWLRGYEEADCHKLDERKARSPNDENDTATHE